MFSNTWQSVTGDMEKEFVKGYEIGRGRLVNEERPIQWSRVMLANGTTSHSRKYAGDLIDAVRDLLVLGRDVNKTANLPVLASFGT